MTTVIVIASVLLMVLRKQTRFGSSLALRSSTSWRLRFISATYYLHPRQHRHLSFLPGTASSESYLRELCFF